MIKDYLRSKYLGRRYQTLIRYINAYHPEFGCELEEGRVPVIHYAGLTFRGFPNSSADMSIYKILKKYLPQEMKPEFYRIVRDVITRYIFPHMIPQLKPLSRNGNSMNGFHGQHKDSLQEIRDPYLREKLIDIFNFRHDDTIVNCGAYIGFGDMRVGRMVPDGKVISLEAKKECFDILERNITANKIANVHPLHKAIWKQNGMMDLNVGELQSNSLVFNASHFGSDPEKDQQQPVEATTIDSLAETMNLSKIDFISLTLNGAEVEAIDGMKEVLGSFSPRIRLAGWYKREGIPIWKICSDKLRPLGYKTVAGRHGSLYAFK